MAQREVPTDRYGSRAGRRPPRWAYWVVLAAAVVVGLVVAVVAYQNLGSQPIEGEQTAFQILDDHSVRIDFQVRRDHPERPADCLVRARSQDGDEVGRKEVLVPAGATVVSRSTVLRTSKRPVTGEVYGCSYQVPSYLTKEARPSG
ncbi:DUF4307 domain-containing protein [Gandjariella thermophila]|uniref:Membrane protein n=1 Tax=Gandjariella thermophila TaxID=1931992 RepID=A0A4D4J5Y2_9PSEU|nr:DUF4307 domain-containing protein [Gandjariella thermophila]GDY29916.1 membrane protein [Gandjariella thermophila]